MKFFINYWENNKIVNRVAEEEETASVIIDSAVAGAAEFVAVVIIVPVEEDKGQFNGGLWRSSGRTYLDRWYNVYHLGVRGY